MEPGDRLLMKGDASLRAAATPARGHEPSSAARKSADLGFEAIPINILLVDDEPKNLTALEVILDDPRYQLIRDQYGLPATAADCSRQLSGRAADGTPSWPQSPTAGRADATRTVPPLPSGRSARSRRPVESR